jgi:tRNA (cmo5U34)-methyltransferase
MSIRDDFNEVARGYEKQIRLIIPGFNDFYSLPLEVMNYNGESPRVLDIGSGTGLFSSFLLSKYPQAKITLIDISDEMMKAAKKNFAAYPDFNFILADYTRYDFTETFDIIISALSIHHLIDDDKKRVYRKCCSMLNGGGCFINADWVLSPSDHIEKVNFNAYQEHHKKVGLSEKEREIAQSKMEHDMPATLFDQLNWLYEAGFKYVDCIYKKHQFSVMYAQK